MIVICRFGDDDFSNEFVLLAYYALCTAAIPRLRELAILNRFRRFQSANRRASTWNGWTWLCLALVVGIGVYFRWSTLVWGQVIYSDSTQYLRFAEDFRSGAVFSDGYSLDDGFVMSRRLSPLYPALVAACSLLRSNLPQVANVVSFVLSTLTLLLVFGLGCWCHSRRAGLAAAALASFNSFLLIFSSSILTEATFTFFFVSSALVTLIAIERRSPTLCFSSGLLCGLTYLTREAGIVSIACSAAAVLIHLIWVQQRAWRTLLKLEVALVTAFLLISSP